jgi:hypothetical protein
VTRWEVERAVLASDLPPQATLVMLVLLTRVDVRTAVIPAEHTPSLTVLTAATRLARSTVATTLNRLERDGWVRRQRPPVEQSRKGARTRYRLTAPSPPHGPASPPHGLPLVRHTDQPSPPHGPMIRPSPITNRDDGLALVIETLELATGKKVSNEDARRAVALAVNSRTVRDPVRYTIKVIRDDANPRRFLPTPTPPSVREVMARATTRDE